MVQLCCVSGSIKPNDGALTRQFGVRVSPQARVQEAFQRDLRRGAGEPRVQVTSDADERD